MTTVEALIDEASHYTASDPDRAQHLLMRALAADPWNARAHRLLGITESDAGNLADAADHLEIATELEPDNPRYWYDLGVVEFRREQVSLACDHFEVALVLRTDYVDALLNLGNCYAAIGDDIAAVTALARTIDLDPTGKRSIRAAALIEDLATRTVAPRPAPRRGLLGLFRGKGRGDSPPVALTPVQRLLKCFDVRAESIERAVPEFEDLLASLDENTRGYYIVTQYLADVYFWLHRYAESYQHSTRAMAGLPCVRSLVDMNFTYLLSEAGKDRDAKRVYSWMIKQLFGVDVSMVTFQLETGDAGGIQSQMAQAWVDNGVYDIIRGGNIFIITTPDGQQIEHQDYDQSDHVLGVWF